MKYHIFCNHSLREGCLFLILGGALLTHGLEGHSQSFNQDWAQSPYLFPVLVAILLMLLSSGLLIQGGREVRLQSDTALMGNTERKTSGIAVLIVLGMSMIYYLLLAVLKIPYITFGIMNRSFTISNFEILTLAFLIAMMLYLGVRKAAVLIFVPLGTTLFLSVAFRGMLHVLLP